jgi:nitrous oxide reductase
MSARKLEALVLRNVASTAQQEAGGTRSYDRVPDRKPYTFLNHLGELYKEKLLVVWTCEAVKRRHKKWENASDVLHDLDVVLDTELLSTQLVKTLAEDLTKNRDVLFYVSRHKAHLLKSEQVHGIFTRLRDEN